MQPGTPSRPRVLCQEIAYADGYKAGERMVAEWEACGDKQQAFDEIQSFCHNMQQERSYTPTPTASSQLRKMPGIVFGQKFHNLRPGRRNVTASRLALRRHRGRLAGAASWSRRRARKGRP